MINAPRACWSVLATKAEEAVALAQAELTQGRARIETLNASRKRLQQLYDDYQKPPEPGSAMLGMQETLNQRQFSAQLLTLLKRVEQDLVQMSLAMAAARSRLAQAERERLKMQSLVDQDLQAFRTAKRRREQKQMDDLGVMQFNLGGAR